MVYVVDDEAVNHIERVGVVDRASTSDLDGGAAAGGARVGHDLNAGGTALKGLHGIGDGSLGQGLRIHGGDGAGDVTLALYTIADDDELVEVVGGLLHAHGQALAGFHVLCRISHITDPQYSTGRYIDAELSVHIGNGAYVRAGFDDAHSHERLPCGVVDDDAIESLPV